MQKQELERLKYPIGKYKSPNEITEAHIAKWIKNFEELPTRLKKLVKHLNPKQLETPYRPGGWTIRQTVHHIADSHHNSYIRFKWTLTENRPTIKPYDEKEWSKLFDAKSAPIGLSLAHLTAVHAKMTYLLKGLSPGDLQRTFVHPDGEIEVSLAENIGRYDWHGDHHYAHIENVLIRKGWK